jgi:MATE family multidrug resistance protein
VAREPGAVAAPPGVGTRDLFRLAWPILVAQLAIIGLATIDAIMAGRLSANDLAGVALGSSVYASIFLGFMGVQQALTPIAGHHFGAGLYREIGIDREQALWLAGFMTVIGMPILLWTDPWMRLAGAPAAVEPIAVQYLTFVACGLPASLLSRTYVSINSAVSRPRVTMMVNLGMLLLKAPLNLVFMYGAGPIPALGGAGCGLASAVLFWLACVAHTIIWHADPFYERFHTQRHSGPRWARQKEMLRLGVPAGLTLLIEISSFTAIAILLVRYGAQVIAGHQIVANLMSLVYMLPLSIGAAASVLVAQSLGAGAPRLARNAALRSLRVALVCGFLVAAALLWQRERLVGIYTADPQVAAIATGLLSVALAFHLFDAMQGTAGFVLRGYKISFAPMAIHAVALWAVGLGGGLWLALAPPPAWAWGPAYGFWTAATVGLGIAAIALTVYALHVSRARIGATATL